MKRAVLALVVLVLGCDETTGPGVDLYPSYFLSSIDGDPLPVPYLPAGSQLIAGGLNFGQAGRPRGEVVTGLVSYALTIRRADQSIDQVRTDLAYMVENDVLRINLCPLNSACITSTELVGPVDRDHLVLTHYNTGQAMEVYRFVAALPD